MSYFDLGSTPGHEHFDTATVESRLILPPSAS
jgi:hypothetical protein